MESRRSKLLILLSTLALMSAWAASTSAEDVKGVVKSIDKANKQFVLTKDSDHEDITINVAPGTRVPSA